MIYHAKVFPNSHQNHICASTNQPNHLEIHTTAKAVGGAANQAIIELVSDFLPCKKSQIFITAGHKSRQKTLEVIT